VDKIMYFEELTKFFQQRYEGFLGNGVDVRQTEEYKEKLQTSDQVITTLEVVVHSCLNLTKGLVPYVFLANPEAARLVCPFPQLLNISSIEQVQLIARKELNDAIDQTFLLGLTSHLILFNHHARPKIGRIDTSLLFTKWAESAAVADMQLKAYNRDSNGIPNGVYLAQYMAQIQPVVKEKLRIGFWKEGKFRSRFRNIYYSGCLLGMESDVAASKIL